MSEINKKGLFTLDNGNTFIDYVVSTILNSELQEKSELGKYNLKRLCCLGNNQPNNDYYEITVPIANLGKYYELKKTIESNDELKKYIDSFSVIKISFPKNHKYIKKYCNDNKEFNNDNCNKFYGKFCDYVYDMSQNIYGQNVEGSVIIPPPGNNYKDYNYTNWASECRCLNSIYKKLDKSGKNTIIQNKFPKIAQELCDGGKCYPTIYDNNTCKNNGYETYQLKPYYDDDLEYEINNPPKINKQICIINNEINTGGKIDITNGQVASYNSYCSQNSNNNTKNNTFNNQNTKTKTNNQNTKTKTNNQNTKTKTNNQNTKTETDNQNNKTETDNQNTKTDTNNQNNKTETDNQNTKTDTNNQNTKTDINNQNTKTETYNQNTKPYQSEYQKYLPLGISIGILIFCLLIFGIYKYKQRN